MAYETEKNRLAQLITDAVGISRTRDSDLEREATERALEARNQTGLNAGSADGYDLIAHPSHEQRLARLGAPATVGTAELATWNYLWNDPVESAANGLLNSPDHRSVLDNSAYTHWGIGIYTEMPPGETNELYRRWWFIIWLATQSIGSAAIATPSQKLNKKIAFAIGTHYGYKFGYDGRLLSSKAMSLNQPSQAQAKGRGRIPNREGDWLLVANGGLTDHWVQEDWFGANPHPKLTQ